MTSSPVNALGRSCLLANTKITAAVSSGDSRTFHSSSRASYKLILVKNVNLEQNAVSWMTLFLPPSNDSDHWNPQRKWQPVCWGNNAWNREAMRNAHTQTRHQFTSIIHEFGLGHPHPTHWTLHSFVTLSQHWIQSWGSFAPLVRPVCRPSANQSK
jgi:hypothetical protein